MPAHPAHERGGPVRLLNDSRHAYWWLKEGAVRYVVFGPGAVGGTMTALLHDAGADVSVIARGAHLDHIRRDGLRLERPDRTVRARIEAYASPADVPWTDQHVVLLAMKTQHATEAISSLAAWAPPLLPVVCTQNGVETERIALRSFVRTYGLCTRLPADHLEPGLVQSYGAPHPGVLDIGRYPAGVDAVAETVATDLRRAGFHVNVDPKVLRSKHRKLLLNLGNALDALGGQEAWNSPLPGRAHEEAKDLLERLGIEVLTLAEEQARGGDLADPVPIGDHQKAGSSTWQSLARGAGEVETDYLNGEIVSLGRQHGIPTPVNEALQLITRQAAVERRAAGSMSVDELTNVIDAAVAATRTA